jgi:hypothetical protein
MYQEELGLRSYMSINYLSVNKKQISWNFDTLQTHYLLPQIHMLNGVIILQNLCELIASTDSTAIHVTAVA